ncbi:MAG: glucose 1-dehydrogenase [Acidobacteria bacterium]|nr:glucose 1-dehydrogenase [Acidobacteriota bacterium]MCI0628164.1 glucose 1-dehydrogenase [Acidobacteriota bacterium]MCI0718819.1 glucose 1-dehydrogenase [Acidobacteriota bacterium]
MKLTGKVALITGGGTGIGRAISLSFAKEGATVVINYSKSEADAVKTSADLQASGKQSSIVKADVSSDKQVRDMVSQVHEKWGRIDILVNNAGFTRFIDPANLEAMEEEIWDSIFAVNLKGVFFCCRAIAPVMKQQGSGRVINIASVAGITGSGSSIAYCASKAGVISVTKSLARVMAPEASVNAIAPGLIDTRWLDGVARANAMRQNFQNAALFKRVGTPEDIAEVALSMAADWGFVTGQVVVVDGGRTL